ncbi:MAG TPA: type II toxin-antitoxin system RelE/ParE family toxin [Allocoleopsis sp.]
MTKRIVITPRASQDIDEHFAYIAQNNSDAALRFFDAVRQTCARLAQMSGLGRPYPVTNPRLEGLRKWQVKGFEKYLIFICLLMTTLKSCEFSTQHGILNRF